jgi:hypothetical protein
MKNENQIIKKNIKRVIRSLTTNLLTLHFETPYCNRPVQNEVLFLIGRLDEVREALEMLTKGNSILNR